MRRGAVAWLGVVAAVTAAPLARPEEQAPPWAAWSASPVALDAALDPLERDALARCGPGEAGLRETAQAIVARKLRGEAMPELDAIALAQRAAGEPHPWARTWAASGRTLDAPQALEKLDGWLASAHDDVSLRRCGVADGAGADGKRVLVVVVVDAVADLAPLPTRVRAGQWLTVQATMRTAARGAKVIVLGPSGAPRTLLGSFDGRTVRARFAPERPGEFAVQVLAELPSGPRPVLEASVFADVEPPAHEQPRAAPGEDADSGGISDDERLARMVARARALTGLPSLARDPRLDAVARDHAERMARTHQLAHDAGDGDPSARLRAAGLEARDVGENVAHASSVALAHRALWASPSHRANVLRADFDRVGLAVARDERGDTWVVEMFADGTR